MSLAVVDASVLTAFYAAGGPDRDAVAARLAVGDALFAPAHLDAEVVSALSGMAQHDATLQAVMPTVLRHLAGFPARRMPLGPLLQAQRIWQLRDNITAYDAAYVALAERLGGPLVTSDGKLAASSGHLCNSTDYLTMLSTSATWINCCVRGGT